jgi:hypothetical protein
MAGTDLGHDGVDEARLGARRALGAEGGKQAVRVRETAR